MTHVPHSPLALLDVRGLDVRFRGRDGGHHAVKQLDFTLGQGETLALVGESGCGKSTTALALLRLLAPEARIAGEVRFRGQDRCACRAAAARDPGRRDLDDLPGTDDLAQSGAYRGRADRRVVAPAPGPVARGRASAGGGDAGAGEDPGAAAPHRGLSAQPVRRPAPARHDRHGRRLPAPVADRRRADHGAGRQRAGAHPGIAGRAASGTVHGPPAHHARPGRGVAMGGPGAGHAGRRENRRGVRRGTAGAAAPCVRRACWALRCTGQGAALQQRAPAEVRRAHGGAAGRQAQDSVRPHARAPRCCRCSPCARRTAGATGTCCTRWTTYRSISRAARRWGWWASPAAASPRCRARCSG